ncbi:mitochondrial co-chaperone GrpE [Cercophora newfieldiana]|uniref:GrpE protein homolog n=1 Tax=Cercophora newfieldiana TaxID=92897 RepID=A0AA39XTX5_9PEZI|nr:mitochondrial co-chaperone GrpE [Cercophora newfieldiana]
MLRQTASTSSRALSSGLRAAVQRKIARPQLFAAPIAASRTVGLQQRARWYSDQPDASKPAEANGEGATKEDPVAALKKQLEEKDAEVRDWKDKYLRSVADFRNLQDRTQRDMKAARDFAIQKFAKDLVDSVDNFDRALTMVPEEKLNATEKTEHLKDLVNLYEGLKMTENILMQTLKNHGLERYDPHGEKFNPNEHEATFMTPMADKEDNTVFHTQQKGFKLNGRILRPAKVGVVKNQ